MNHSHHSKQNDIQIHIFLIYVSVSIDKIRKSQPNIYLANCSSFNAFDRIRTEKKDNV